jgi:hypothetical protein
MARALVHALLSFVGGVTLLSAGAGLVVASFVPLGFAAGVLVAALGLVLLVTGFGVGASARSSGTPPRSSS